jgi:hypothetical protein
MRMMTRCSIVTWASWMGAERGSATALGIDAVADAAKSSTDRETGDTKSCKTFYSLGVIECLSDRRLNSRLIRTVSSWRRTSGKGAADGA